jgi:hypothetical protein
VRSIKRTKDEKKAGELFNRETSVTIPSQDLELDGDDDSSIENFSCFFNTKSLVKHCKIAGALNSIQFPIISRALVLPEKGSVIVFNFDLAGIRIIRYKLNKVSHNLIIL